MVILLLLLLPVVVIVVLVGNVAVVVVMVFMVDMIIGVEVALEVYTRLYFYLHWRFIPVCISLLAT